MLAALLTLGMPAAAQLRQPVKWKAEAKKVKKNVYDITATGTIRSGWHIYDLQEQAGGPNPTVFMVSGETVEAMGPAKITSEVHRALDPVFNLEIGTCENTVIIVQRVRALQDGPCDVQVHVEGQACNEGNCLPPDDFETTLQVDG